MGTFAMRLTQVEIINYRCHKNTIIPIYDVTVLIGPNDSGKSSVLSALDLFFDIPMRRSVKKPDVEDFYRNPQGKQESKMEIICTFVNEDGEEIRIKKGFELLADKNEVVGPKWYIFAEAYVNDEFQEIDREISKGRPEKRKLIDFIKRYVSPNIEERILLKMKLDELKEIIKKFLLRQEKTKKWVEIDKGNEILSKIPRFELYDSNEYENPENYLRKILSSHFNEILNEDEVREVVSNFEQVITEKLNERLSELSAFLENSLAIAL